VQTIDQYEVTEFQCDAAATSGLYGAGPYPTPFTVANDAATTTSTTTGTSGESVTSTFNFSFTETTGTGTLTQSGSILAPPSGGGPDQLTDGCATGEIPLTLAWKPPI
jgi:hypothetical protein